ncbi:alkylated DNA repair protein alkB homolog 8 [Sitophilus oryzae]|uniref:tRNA (carboxymethyluridine(34)-5-O)-methyltransferase n=1 Tax=Sitophilus oryzae TaxID=7048 RepID=A0A6J2XU28_SITOR|nr:alkylated DNA repair protein alkB homolog 8 [Sitophilus oryzae]
MEVENQTFSMNKQKKVSRKLKRLQFMIERDTGTSCNQTATQNLVICNAGLVNGLSQEILYEHFSKHGSVIDIRLVPGKSYCFVSFSNVDSAINAYNEFNGKLKICQDNKPMYLLYIQVLPEVNSLYMWDKLPLGLILCDDFITSDEESTLLELCNFNTELIGIMKNRLVKHFGYEFRYDINNVDKTKPLNETIPCECNFLWKRLSDSDVKSGFKDFNPDQLTVNHYSPGQGIPHHIDTHSAFEDPIICLSLGSPVVMEFKNQDKHVCVLLPRRSLLIMSEESRYAWSHGIVPRKFDVIKNDSVTGYTSLKRGTRVSFTFRKILNGECKCNYKEKCDSGNNKQALENSVASKLEKLHVHEIYQNIAHHFSDTRHKPWPNVLKFIQSLDMGSIVIDVGCGNGKYLGNKDIYDIGCDYSSQLVSICKFRGYEVCVADCLKIPLRDDIADAALSIAVIHHLANEMRRLEALKEIVRVLKVGGKALIYVWAHEQIKNEEKSSYLKQDRKNRKKIDISDNSPSNIETIILPDGCVSFPVHTNRKEFKAQDVLVPWKLKDENKSTFLRYYHVFDEDELVTMCKKLSNVRIETSYYDQGNVCVILEKIQ